MSALRPATPTKITRLNLTTTSVGNGADTTEDTLQSFTIPANTLVNVGDTLRIIAGGVFAASTDNKTVRVKLGGTAISSPTGITAGSIRWGVEAWVVKTGSNTQSYLSTGATVSGTQGTDTFTLSLTDTSTIALTITGQNSTNSSANSVTCRFLIVELQKA